MKWDDSHESTYDLQWLLERNFNEGQERHENQQVKWTAESFSAIFRSFKYEDVIKRSYLSLSKLCIHLSRAVHIIINY